MKSVGLDLTDLVGMRRSDALPDISENERQDCIRGLAQEAMEAIPAYLAELRDN